MRGKCPEKNSKIFGPVRSSNLNVSTLCPQKTPPEHVLKMIKISKVCAITMSIFNKIANSIVKISFTVTEILPFNKWSSDVYHLQKRAFLLTFHGVDIDVSIDALAKQFNKMVFSSKDFVLVKVLRQEKKL